MESEHDHIPFHPVALRGEKVLVLAPHPDDEVIGCGGVLAQHAAERRRVHVVVATDGSAADPAESDLDQYRRTREAETNAGLAALGLGEAEFLRFPDRDLGKSGVELQKALRKLLDEHKPDLILTPSPIEIHPDHIALTRALVDLIQSDGELQGRDAMTRIAFYEVSQPIRPNTLVDISDTAEKKFSAISKHDSQLRIRDYERLARGLNAYRALSLAPQTEFAEAYWVTEMSRVRTESWSRLAELVGPASNVQVTREALPITVVVRTKNRPQWLAEALESVRATQYPATVIVVNDGGRTIRDVVGASDGFHVIDHEVSRGRSEAMNSGVRAAKTKYVAFLDDDDLYYPEHLATLAHAARSGNFIAYYTDAVSNFLELGDDGTYRSKQRLRIFANEFDRDLLYVDNYIPLATLMMERDTFLDVGGFDNDFDLFEDWDFLLRLSRRGSFVRIPRVTCEIRHFLGGDSAILASPAESEKFRAAKKKVWENHRDFMTDELLMSVFERQKQRLLRAQNHLGEEKGRSSHLERDVARLQREAAGVVDELQTTSRNAQLLEQRLRETSELLARTEAALRETREALDASGAVVEAYKRHVVEYQRDIAQKDRMLRDLFGEVDRLNAILQQIYDSRTWKLHQLVHRVRGRDV